ncbi:hypothetical protein P6U16_01315 [Rhizobium sp. 32-5/1]|uniref:hypothetical protein n=1 Tax=Rhizobium sp. 32-5/1 TaxID=3019602 RepID=UPI00240D27AC|nr:hypothetical protein [Rhizobium sp. 32-5/1]WEZ83525.1 hypothetical protein P6U16_01315 [Rhizobium sp. 32-5/1]
MKFSVAALTALVFLTTSQNAFSYCSEPSAPSCASGYGSFTDEYEFESCKNDMERFKSQVEEFVDCNNNEAQIAADEATATARRAQSEAEEVASKAKRDSDEAIDSYSRAVNDFNSRASQ